MGKDKKKDKKSKKKNKETLWKENLLNEEETEEMQKNIKNIQEENGIEEDTAKEVDIRDNDKIQNRKTKKEIAHTL